MPTPDIKLSSFGASVIGQGNFRETRGVFQVILDPVEMEKVRKRMEHIRLFFVGALGAVAPEFGAYTSYSRWLEEGTWKMEARPHIIPAIDRNREYIRRGLQRKISDYALSFAQGKHPTYPQAVAFVTAAWEEVLNAKPRYDAQRSAPVEFGFHRATIRAYGQPRMEADVVQQARNIDIERAKLKAQLGSDWSRARISQMKSDFERLRNKYKRKR